MSKKNITLTYFPLRARGEITRLLLHAAKQPFTDTRLSFEQWPAVKPKTPTGTLPMLEVDGRSFGQGIAIAIYLSKEFGFHGSNNLEAFRIDEIQMLREDLLTEEAKYMFEKDEAKKAELEKKLVGESYHKYLAIFNRFIEANTGSKYTVGNKLSLADIVIFEGTQTCSEQQPAVLDKYPAIKALRQLVAGTDGIKQYLASREKSFF